MRDERSRRDFVFGMTGVAALGLVPAARAAAGGQATIPAAASASFPSHEPLLAKEIVTVSHGRLARVRELVERQPALARASIDWGFGDWETCIDAASHMGQREIAELLIAHGARPTLFTAAMLGHVDVVKAAVAAQPGVQRSYGPHGITLMAHARAGGPDAEVVVRYLAGLGDADTPLPSAPLSRQDRDAVVGRYRFGVGAADYLDVDVQNDQPGINRPGGNARRSLVHTGDLVFFPAGVPSVRIAFARDAGLVRRLTVADPEVFLTAERVG